MSKFTRCDKCGKVLAEHEGATMTLDGMAVIAIAGGPDSMEWDLCGECADKIARTIGTREASR